MSHERPTIGLKGSLNHFGDPVEAIRPRPELPQGRLDSINEGCANIQDLIAEQASRADALCERLFGPRAARDQPKDAQQDAYHPFQQNADILANTYDQISRLREALDALESL